MIIKKTIALLCACNMLFGVAAPSIVMAQEPEPQTIEEPAPIVQQMELQAAESQGQTESSEPNGTDSDIVQQMPLLPAEKSATEAVEHQEEPSQEDNQKAFEEWQKIDGRWYAFEESNGQKKTGFVEKTEGADQGWYFYNEDGSLYPEGWHDVNGSLRYVEANGKFATGWKQAPDGRHYLGASGYSYKGWNKIDGRWYHLDETSGAQQLGWQYRNEDGVRYTFYYFENGTLMSAGWGTVNGYKRYVEADGSMHMGWLKDGGNTYYTSASGIPLTGYQIIEGKGYFFDNDGKLKNFEEWQKVDGRWYAFEESNGQKKTGFVEKTEGADQGWYFYNEDGSLYPEGWHDVNGSLRYVEANGKFATGWKQAPDGRHYLGASGYSYKGWNKIDGRWYHLDETSGAQQLGWQYRNEDGVRYTFYYFENGTLMSAGWGTVNGYKRYVEADGSMHMGWLKDGGYSYYTGASGIPLTGYQIIEGKGYFFDNDGKLKNFEEWQKIDGRWYAFEESNGQKKTGFVEKTEGADQGWYFYNEDGSLYPEGWHDVNGSLRYVEANGKFATGWKQAPDGRHYLGASGYSYKGWNKIDGRWYHLDETSGVQQLGWQYRNEDGVRYTFYYFENGTLMPVGWGTLNGYKRYVEADGSMHMGWLKDGGYTYYTGASGIPLTGYQIIEGKGYFFDNDGKLNNFEQWKKIDGRWYAFDQNNGQKKTGFVEKKQGEDQGWYFYNEDGSLYPEGWHEINGSLRYVEANGKFATGWKQAPDGRHYLGASGYSYKGWNKIDGRWYHLDETSGAQQLGWQYRDENGTRYSFYYFGNGTLMPAGWGTLNGYKRYVEADGSMHMGWLKDGGYTYYTGASGIPFTGIQVVDGKGHQFDQEGRLQKVTAHGWTTIEGKRYYASNGYFLAGWAKLYDRWYSFNPQNAYQELGFQEKTEGFDQGWYFYKEDGNLYPKGWHEINGSLRYVEGIGKFATGWKQAPDGRHYLGASGYSYKGWHKIDGIWYYLHDKTGVQQLGWQTRQDGGKSYRHYFHENGDAAVGWHNSTENRYYFLADGTMATGWQTIEGKRYYFDLQKGAAYRNGVYTIDGIKYSFDSYGVATQLKPNDTLAIDVSYHQGIIDWQAVASSGIQYAIIRAIGWNKAAQTVGGVDNMFDYNVREAKKYGIKVGAYIYTYAKNHSEVEQEVSAFVGAMQRLERDGYRLDLPVFVDQEDNSLLQGLTNGDRTNLLRTEMVMLEQKGYYPGMYMSTSWSQTNVDAEALYQEGYDMWVADYRTSVQNPVWAGRCALWQYSSKGQVPGIRTNVDMNYIYKNYSGLIQGSNNTGGTSEAKFQVRNENSNGAIVEDTMLNLLAAIVNNEVGNGLGLTGADRMNLYRSQAIAAHSWLLYSYVNSNDIPSVGLNYNGNYHMIREQIAEVQDKIITYQGQPALAVYGSCNNGKTNAAGDYWNQQLPYLPAGIESKYDRQIAPQYFPTVSRPRTAQEISSELKRKHGIDTTQYADPSTWFVINGRNSGNYITSLNICGKTIKGGTLNDNFSPIRSSDFTVEYDAGQDRFTFKSYGNGHGIGMSQFGAAGYIGNEGWGYTEVLKHYFPNTSIETIDS